MTINVIIFLDVKALKCKRMWRVNIIDERSKQIQQNSHRMTELKSEIF